MNFFFIKHFISILFKILKKRISKNDKNVIVDASRQLSEVYFPPIYRVADKNFKSQQILSEISCHLNKTPQQIQIDFQMRLNFLCFLTVNQNY